MEFATEDIRRREDTSDDPARVARLEHGGIAQALEAMRDQRGLPWLADLGRDIRYALRSLRQNPVFVATAVLTVALGIGANTAIFSIVNAVLLKPAPFPDSDRIVLFMLTTLRNPVPLTAPARFEYLSGQWTIEDAAAFRTGAVRYGFGDASEQLSWAQVSANYFKLFGAPILLGRGFSQDEDLPGGPKAAVVSYSLWTRRFAASPNIIGDKISLNDQPYVVIGVVGPGFDFSEFGAAPEVWTAFQFDPNTIDQGQYFQAAARLKPGVTLQQAQNEFKEATTEYRKRFPSALAPINTFTVQPIQEALVGSVRQTLYVLSAAVGFLLLIACANVANLLLMRAAGRQREIAIRASLGANRSRIVRQLLTESILLAIAGGALGVLFGMWGISALLAVNTAGLPRLGDKGSLVDVDWRVLGFTLIVSLVTGVAFGLVPALQSSRTDLHSAFKESSRGMGAGFRRSKFRAVLIIAEIALSVTLLIGCVLLIRTRLDLDAVDPGFQTTNVLTMKMLLTGERYQHAPEIARAVGDGVDRIRALPGVVDAAAATVLPLQLGPGGPFRIIGRPLVKGPFHGGGAWAAISPSYFNAFHIPVKRGRAFTDNDDKTAQPVVIINESLARQFWVKDDDPLNARILIAKGLVRQFDEEPERQIVGIVGDVHGDGLNSDPGPAMYVPQAQLLDAQTASGLEFSIAWIVRSKVSPSSLSRQIQEQLHQTTGVPAYDVKPMRMFALEGMALAVLGITIGVALAMNLTNLIRGFLFGVKPWDPTTFVSVPALVSATVLLAVWLPSRRATRANLADTLRCE